MISGNEKACVILDEMIADIGDVTATIRMPAAINAQVVVLGNPAPSVEMTASVSAVLDDNGVSWK